MDLQLSHFCQMDVIRDQGKAYVIFDTDEDGNKIRLIGFESEASKDNFIIQEEAFHYFQALKNELSSK